MTRIIASLVLSIPLVLAPILTGNALAQTAPGKDSKTAKSEGAKTAQPGAAPSDKEIAEAKSKGMVWVNLSNGIYHKEGNRYGKTKTGKFMSEDEAKKAGYRPAKRRPGSPTDAKKP